MELTDEQLGVSDAIMDFVADKNGPESRYLAVAGYAGTGKTTVMCQTAARLRKAYPRMSIAFCAPTGKAASVLGTKLSQFNALNQSSTVSTVHSLIYTPRKNKKAARGVEFSLRGLTKPYDLLVIDEASMVTKGMFADLRKQNTPTLYIGDAGQLPPVNDELFAPLVQTELRLNTVHRQALQNPITRWATEVRYGNTVPFGSSKDFAKLHKGSSSANTATSAFLGKILNKNTIVLCGMNQSRVRLNNAIRTQLGFTGPLPQPGECLVCLKNNPVFSLFNGQLFKAERSEEIMNSLLCYRLYLEELPGQMLVSFVPALNAKDGSEIYQKLAMHTKHVKDIMFSFADQKEIALFDYGYAISVHKAQGSEWDNVLLFDERNSHMSDDEYIRWLYTGMTRAKEKLCIVV